MRLRRFLREFDPADPVRGAFLPEDPATGYLELATGRMRLARSNSLYAARAVLRSPMARPAALERWLMMEADIQEPAGTTVRMRLTDGEQDYAWDGTAWHPDIQTFNTPTEVVQHLAAWPHHTLGLVFELATTAPALTPSVGPVLALWEGRIDPLEDLLYRTLVPALREVRPVLDVVVALDEATDRIVVPESMLAGIPLVGCEGAFDLGTDPVLPGDLLTGYDAEARTATLFQILPAGSEVKLHLVAVPEVVVTAHQDYAEAARLPAIVIEGPAELRSSRAATGPVLVDPATAKAWRFSPVTQTAYRVTLRAVTNSGIDQQRLASAIDEFLATNLFLVSRGLDEPIPVRVSRGWRAENRPNLTGLHEGTIEIELLRVPRWVGEDEQIPVIQKVVVTTSP